MTERNHACLACGGQDFQDGHLVWNAPIRFKTEKEGSFRRGTRVAARACQACGHIDLHLED